MKLNIVLPFIASLALVACGPMQGPTKLADDAKPAPEQATYTFPNHHPMAPSGVRKAGDKHRYTTCKTSVTSDYYNRDTQACITRTKRPYYGEDVK